MNNLSLQGLITCFIFSIVFNGTSVTHDLHTSDSRVPFIVNNSPYTIYFKPESRKKNPGLDPNSAYPLAPGAAYFLPFDAVTTPAIESGKIFRLPTGSTVIIDAEGTPRASNLVGQAGSFLPAYGVVESPCVNFATLANPKVPIYLVADINVANY